MEIVKSKKANIIVLIIGFIFFFSACSLAQIERMVTFDSISNKEVVTKYSSDVLELKSPLFSKESILINAKSDSVNSKTITFDLFVYFPKNINPEGANIVLGYIDGTTEVLQQSLYIQEDNYAEYHPIEGINNLAYKKISYVLVRGIVKVDTKQRTFFSDFLSYL